MLSSMHLNHFNTFINLWLHLVDKTKRRLFIFLGSLLFVVVNINMYV